MGTLPTLLALLSFLGPADLVTDINCMQVILYVVEGGGYFD
jgi:hypothetical protein